MFLVSYVFIRVTYMADNTFSTLVRQGVRLFRKPQLNVPEYDPDEHGSLINYSIEDKYEEIDRYWVNSPYSFVVIKFDPVEREILYEVVEPDLTEFQQQLLRTLVNDIQDSYVYRIDKDESTTESLKTKMMTLIEEYDVDITINTFYRIYYYIERNFDGYGKIDPIMEDDRIEDISCVGYGLPIFVYHEEYTSVRTNITFGRTDLDNYIVRLAQQSGRHISIADPIVQTTLPNGSRAELALGDEVTPRGSSFTIRKYSENPFTPIDLIQFGTFDVSQMAYLWFVIEHQKSILFAGGTASGKTTSMNAVSMFIPPISKIVTIEDTRELTLYHDNWLASLTRESNDANKRIDMYDLLRSSLRHRPEYIIVGEVRGEEAITLFQAMNTGHTTFSTMHADSVKTAINRLENKPINVPRSMVTSLDVLCVQRLLKVDGERERRNAEVAEIQGVGSRNDSLEYSTTYEWNPENDTFNSKSSDIIDEIKNETGQSLTDVKKEIKRREIILEYLVDAGISNYREFTRIINQYYVAPEKVIEMIEKDATTTVEIPDSLKTVTVDNSVIEGVVDESHTTPNTDSQTFTFDENIAKYDPVTDRENTVQHNIEHDETTHVEPQADDHQDQTSNQNENAPHNNDLLFDVDDIRTTTEEDEEITKTEEEPTPEDADSQNNTE